MRKEEILEKVNDLKERMAALNLPRPVIPMAANLTLAIEGMLNADAIDVAEHALGMAEDCVEKMEMMWQRKKPVNYNSNE